MNVRTTGPIFGSVPVINGPVFGSGRIRPVETFNHGMGSMARIVAPFTQTVTPVQRYAYPNGQTFVRPIVPALNYGIQSGQPRPIVPAQSYGVVPALPCAAPP